MTEEIECHGICEYCPEKRICREYNRDNIMYQMLIDDLIESIKDQNLEIIALRRLLMRYIRPEYRDGLQDDIFSALYPQTVPISYDSYIQEFYRGRDPFDEPGYIREMKKYASGKMTQYHPNIYREAIKTRTRTRSISPNINSFRRHEDEQFPDIRPDQIRDISEEQ